MCLFHLFLENVLREDLFHKTLEKKLLFAAWQLPHQVSLLITKSKDEFLLFVSVFDFNLIYFLKWWQSNKRSQWGFSPGRHLGVFWFMFWFVWSWFTQFIWVYFLIVNGKIFNRGFIVMLFRCLVLFIEKLLRWIFNLRLLMWRTITRHLGFYYTTLQLV